MNKDFINTLSIKWTNIEYISITNKNVSVINEYTASVNKTENIYFLSGVNPSLVYKQGVRAKDADIIKKTYFCIDIDIRNNCKEEYWEDISDDDIIKCWENLANDLKKEDEYFWEWRYIVYTWNWLHIYYLWDVDSFNQEEYKKWVSRIFRKWDENMWWQLFKSDHSCCNIARILRLPWSINQKNWQEVRIIAEQNIKSRLFNHIKWFAKKEEEELNKIKEQQRIELEEKMKSYSNDEKNIYDLILTIPAYQIAQLLLPEFPYDWKRNFKNNQWWFTWYYYSESKNIIINWWSRHFNWLNDTSWWNNFELIKRFKWYTNKETFSFYKQLLNIKN